MEREREREQYNSYDRWREGRERDTEPKKKKQKDTMSFEEACELLGLDPEKTITRKTLRDALEKFQLPHGFTTVPWKELNEAYETVSASLKQQREADVTTRRAQQKIRDEEEKKNNNTNTDTNTKISSTSPTPSSNKSSNNPVSTPPPPSKNNISEPTTSQSEQPPVPRSSPQVAPVAQEEKTVKNQFSLRTALVSAGMAAAGTMEFLRQQNLTDIAGSFGGKAAEYLTSANHYHHLKLSDPVKATEAIQQWTTNAQTAGFHGNSVEAVGKNISHFANQDVVGHLCAGIGTAAAIHAALGIARDVHKMATGQETVTGGKVADLALKAAQVGVGAAAHAGFVNPATGTVIAACRLGLHLSQEETLNKARQLKDSIEKNRTSGELQGVRQVLSAMHLVGATVYCETAQGANNIRKALGNTIGNSMQALQSRFTPEQQQTVEQGIEMVQAMINNAQGSDTVAPELRALPKAMEVALKTPVGGVLSTETTEKLQAGGQIMQYSTHENAHVVTQAVNILKEGHNLNAGLENAANTFTFNRGSEAVNA